MRFNKTTGFGNILNLIQIDAYICEKMDTEVSDFLNNCDLE